jgi:hypothetical protein
MSLKINFTVASLFVTCILGYAQQSALKLKIQVPVQFGLGYEGKISKHFSFQASAGALTPPNSTLIINTLDALGTDPQVVLMIKDAFQFGFVGESGVNYNFKKNYVGIFFQLIDLHGGDTPTSLVEGYFNTSITGYPAKKGRTAANEKFLHLKSTLYQGGILYGRRFPFKNEHWEIDAEAGISANLSSQSKLTSDERDLSALSKLADAELAGYYKDYAFVPSLAVFLVYKPGIRIR